MASKVWEWLKSLLRYILEVMFRLFHRELSEKKFAAILQFVKFGVVGLSNTVISYLTYIISLLIFRKFGLLPSYDYIISQAVGFVISVAWSFYWNNRYVFSLQDGEYRSFWKALIKTYISYSFTGLFLNSVLLYAWVHFLQISEYIAPILNLLISVPLNFIINKYWAFKSRK